ncbi:MAG TPA: tetratricopeptide repeat protein [Candidatus Babeliales bacterium]|nr:tetratricopeptide repeat protein [Candidatus Babeliales bacterium]
MSATSIGVGVVIVLAAVISAATTSVHLPVSTGDPQAQALFDRGLFYYYAYDGPDAVRAFRAAAQRDPRLAMAYWGVALAYGPDLNTPLTVQRFGDAGRAVAQAVARYAGLPAWERTFIEAMAQRYRGTFANRQSDETAYRRAMLAFATSSGDENAQLLTAEALFEDGGLTWRNGALASDEARRGLELVTSVLNRDPTNPMANHLCIHAFDFAPRRTPALACAKRLDAASFPPQAEHLAHMAAHYWIETGNYAAALASSERTYALVSQLYAEEPLSEHVTQYAGHDVTLGYSAAMMLGNYAVALRWAQRMGGVFKSRFEALTALRFGRSDQAFSAGIDQFGEPSVRGFAAVQLHQLDDARSAAAAIRAAGVPAHGYLPQLFLARFAEATGNRNEAERWIDVAQKNQHLELGGERIPLIPAEEALGGFFLRSGRNDEAAAAFTAALAAYPDDPRALFGLASALEASGKRAQAAQARARFDAVWEGSDTNLDADALP